MEVIIFGLKLTLKPVAFTIDIAAFTWDIYWYGIIIALGFLLALIYGYKNAARFGINLDRMLDVILVAVPVAILSARAYYIIFDDEKLTSIGDFFGFGDSSGFAGLAIYGGIIGAFVSGGLMCIVRKVKIFDMFDLAALGFLIGQGIGRWGNFINQEAFGTLTGSSWWGMQSRNTINKVGEGMVHPCFLYESVWCILGFFILHKLSKKRSFSGEVALMYCAWYGLGRGFIELLRTDSLMWGPFRVSALLSYLLCITSVILLIVFKKKLATANETYTALFDDPDEEETELEEEFSKEIAEESEEQNDDSIEEISDTEEKEND